VRAVTDFATIGLISLLIRVRLHKRKFAMQLLIVGYGIVLVARR
jgi:hypothetical protein